MIPPYMQLLVSVVFKSNDAEKALSDAVTVASHTRAPPSSTVTTTDWFAAAAEDDESPNKLRWPDGVWLDNAGASGCASPKLASGPECPMRIGPSSVPIDRR